MDFTIFQVLIGISMSIFNLFVYCYFGMLASESFENIADCLYEMNWHELPLDLQKYFVIMIGNAQRPLFYHGYGMTTMNLETFCDVRKFILIYTEKSDKCCKDFIF